MADYSIYLSTCDGYSDCWDPFFTLFERYWPSFDGKVYMSTEYKDYDRDHVIPMKLCESHSVPKTKRVTWSKLTRWGLEAIPEDIILFMQEDFFLKAPVNHELIAKYCDLMLSNPDIKCIHLTDQNGSGSVDSEYEGLDLMLTHRPYRISCQSALWRKEELLALLRDRESAWDWEIFGSARSAALGHKYYQVKRDFVKLDQFEIVPYVFTGIIKGKWIPQVVPLFQQNGIEVDFSKRGFYNPETLIHTSTFNERLVRLKKRIHNKLDIKFIQFFHKTR